MGFENRDYAQDSSYSSYGGGFGTQSSGVVKKIVIVTIAVFVLQILTSSGRPAPIAAPADIRDNQSEAEDTAETPNQARPSVDVRPVPQSGETLGPLKEIFAVRADYVVFRGQVWRLLTYAFLHSTSGPMHLLFNMLVLWSLGRAVEELLGGKEFLWFYLVSAVFAAICYVLFAFGMALAGARGIAYMLGASGAVRACLVLYALHYPNRKISLFGVFELEARVLVAGLLILDALPLASRIAGFGSSNVAHTTHLGGALFAWIYFKRQMRLSSITQGFNFGAMKRKVKAKRSDLKIYAPAPEPRRKDAVAAETVDAILAKISEHGEESLTKSERETLKKASKQYRDR